MMKDELRTRVISFFGLTSDQQEAALERERDVIVTAGAGSGKTRTLVARYVSLLLEGHTPRSITAVTFTERAAREMRSRVRLALNDLVKNAETAEERQRWNGIISGMDSARIGTIHSLCSELLRAHPAEAGIDPKFDVLDEGLTTVLRARVVEDTLTILVGQPDYATLFEEFEVYKLNSLLVYLLDHRLDAREVFDNNQDSSTVIRQYLETNLKDPRISECIETLRSLRSSGLVQDAGEKLADMIEELLHVWEKAEIALSEGDLVTSAGHLFNARRDYMKKNIGSKTSQAKGVIAQLQSVFDNLLDPLTGGKGSKDLPPDAETEIRYNRLSLLIHQVFNILLAAYKEALQQRRSLDFDDLEYGAAELLKRAEICARWQGEISALLVDEFQDTNERQRQIVEGLTGAPGRLFVVGDARQSIYRFRRADVTVFRSVQERAKAEGGLVIDLNLTYRAHEPLLNATSDLLQVAMGTEADPLRPYYVPFSPLKAFRKEGPDYIHAPHIEFVIGTGEDTATARPRAAQALAVRLIELKEQKQIKSWDDVTLLFRASTGFPFYENAFEDAGIPFVTVAGRGFYDRPEIRDVINILRALADPTDDLALAGLLRSPAFGLSDAALYQLRCRENKLIPYWAALQGDLEMLDRDDRQRAVRSVSILNDLFPFVDRIPVAELLKKLVDMTDYRSILAVDGSGGTGGRLWRNLDKLLTDAQDSGQVNVRDFLTYLATINDAGVREGEAPAEAQGSVRLMSIHRSKGLEFPIVVLADASREPKGNNNSIYLLPNFGLAFRMDPAPMHYRLAKLEDKRQNDAEKQRLLYVAMTRAKDKLIISGHVTTNKKNEEWTGKGWLDSLSNTVHMDLGVIAEESGKEILCSTSSGQAVRGWALPNDAEPTRGGSNSETNTIPETNAVPIFAPLSAPGKTQVSGDEPAGICSYRATGTTQSLPPKVIGSMVHKALELWLFPDNPRLGALLETAARESGLCQLSQCDAAVRHATDLLGRLSKHPLRSEIETAADRYHELPYCRKVDNYAEIGFIDLLFRASSGWQIIDFKTDSIRSIAEREHLSNLYTRQMCRYSNAIEALIGQKPITRICFLDSLGKIELVNQN